MDSQHKELVMQNVDGFFAAKQDKLLNKQWSGRWN